MDLHQGIEGSCLVRRSPRKFRALIGIGLASTGVIASGFFHIAWADGAASVAVGLLLASVAWFWPTRPGALSPARRLRLS